MNKFIPRLPSPGMVVAIIALFVSLGGTGYAATQLSGSPTAVAAKASKKKKKPAVKVLRGKTGPTGPTGATGAQGKEGGAGKNGANGANGSNGSSEDVAGYKNGPVFLPFSSTIYTTIASLALPSGKWTVFAKAYITNNAGAGNTEARCQLVSPSGDFDETEAALEDVNVAGSAHAGAIAMNVNTELPSGGTISLNCRNEGGGNSNARFIKITALQVASLSNSVIP